jgi:UDP-N-acetylmuramoyl-L-alanyl-D-glutamate--2,6-diaminopimelate ligase
MKAPAQATIPERHLAIAYAIGHAIPGDLILIAGKGHETGQTAAGQTIPFKDQSVAEHILGDMPC